MLFVFTLAMAMALQGDARFDEGVRLYKQTEYEDAIVRFEAVSTRADLSPADRAQALLWLGLAHPGSGDVDTARRTFREALTADATVALPAQTSPSIVTVFDDVRAELAAEASAPAPVAPIEPAAGPPSIVFIGGGVAAGGAVLLVTGGVLAALAAGSLETANDDEQFQSDAKAALDAANGQALGAGLLLPLGAALAVAGGALVAMNLE